VTRIRSPGVNSGVLASSILFSAGMTVFSFSGPQQVSTRISVLPFRVPL